MEKKRVIKESQLKRMIAEHIARYMLNECAKTNRINEWKPRSFKDIKTANYNIEKPFRQNQDYNFDENEPEATPWSSYINQIDDDDFNGDFDDDFDAIDALPSSYVEDKYAEGYVWDSNLQKFVYPNNEAIVRKITESVINGLKKDKNILNIK